MDSVMPPYDDITSDIYWNVIIVKEPFWCKKRF